MGDLGTNALFQERLLAHARSPRHAGRLAADAAGLRSVHAVNPLCGDELQLDVAVGAGAGEDALHGAFESKGCALCRASASIMLDAVTDQPAALALALGQRLRQAFAAGAAPGAASEDPWPGDVAALLDIRAYPARSRCVLLAWEALAEALQGGPHGQPHPK